MIPLTNSERQHFNNLCFNQQMIKHSVNLKELNMNISFINATAGARSSHAAAAINANCKPDILSWRF